MTITDSANGRIRINVSQSVKGVETVEFTVEVGDATNVEMTERLHVAWVAVDKMRVERGFRKWGQGSA